MTGLSNARRLSSATPAPARRGRAAILSLLAACVLASPPPAARAAGGGVAMLRDGEAPSHAVAGEPAARPAVPSERPAGSSPSTGAPSQPAPPPSPAAAPAGPPDGSSTPDTAAPAAASTPEEASPAARADRCVRAAREASSGAEPLPKAEGAATFAALHDCWFALFNAGHYDAALTVAKAGNELFPAEPQSGFDYGATLVLAGRDAAAAKGAIEQALSRPGRFTTTPPLQRSLALSNLGRILLSQGEARAARERFLQALKLDPGRAELLYALAAADRKAGDPAACLAHSREAFAKAPEAADSDAYLVAAWAFLRSNRAPEAEALLRRGIEAMPNAAGLHLNLGFALAAIGKPVDALLEYLYEIENGSADSPYTKEAAALFREGLSKPKAAPEFSEAIATLDAVLTQRQKDPVATLADLIRLEVLGYRHPTLDLFRAGTLYANGDARAAERILRTLIGTDPGFLPPYFDLSQILADSNRQEEGRRFVAEAVRRNPAHWMLTGRFPLPELNPN